MEDRKDLTMRNRRNFSLEFKRQVIEELLSFVADTTSHQDYSIIGRSNTDGSLTTSLSRKLLLKTG